MRSLAVQRHGSSRCGSRNRSSRCGSSRRHSRRGLSLSPSSSRATPIAAAETREGRGQKAHGARGRVLSNNSTKLRNAKADRVVSNAKVVSNVKSAKVLWHVTGRAARRPPFLCRSLLTS